MQFLNMWLMNEPGFDWRFVNVDFIESIMKSRPYAGNGDTEISILVKLKKPSNHAGNYEPAVVLREDLKKLGVYFE